MRLSPNDGVPHAVVAVTATGFPKARQVSEFDIGEVSEDGLYLDAALSGHSDL